MRFDDHTHSCHCEERAKATATAIHRVSENADDLSLRLPVPSGSPRAFSPRDDHTHFVIARRERKRETRQSIVSRKTQKGNSLRSLAHSGSPRAFSPRDDRVVLEGPALTRLALINPVPHRHGSRLRRRSYRHFLRFRRILCLQVNRGSGMR